MSGGDRSLVGFSLIGPCQRPMSNKRLQWRHTDMAHSCFQKRVSCLIGLFLIWVAVGSPIPVLDHELLTVHMLEHLLLMTLAPPLIWLGAPFRPPLHGLPERLVESLLVP